MYHSTLLRYTTPAFSLALALVESQETKRNDLFSANLMLTYKWQLLSARISAEDVSYVSVRTASGHSTVPTRPTVRCAISRKGHVVASTVILKWCS